MKIMVNVKFFYQVQFFMAFPNESLKFFFCLKENVHIFSYMVGYSKNTVGIKLVTD